ncbi:hypothetical protein AB2B41_01270 [Marimonas sp. MJW-29]|uniref:Uncharacterized protein n=1 Tax=Sulfitobacter sediminis TaxID=3234186 RepID=A0ABV3RIK8_9RHOB
MTDAAYIAGFRAGSKAEAEALPMPPPRPFDGPVFIPDCIIPAGGETLLSLLMKKMMQESEAPDDRV